jgi:hypothetical protein
MKTTLAVVAVFAACFQLHAQVSFTLSSSPVVGTNPFGVTAADVNGDGKVDLICANFTYGDTLTVLTNNGGGGFATSTTCLVGNGPTWVTATDVNSDGKVDLISVNWADNSLTVLTNNGGGGFVSSSTCAVGSYPTELAAADVNKDGKVDLVCVNGGDNTLTVLTNAGSGHFALASTLNTTGSSLSVTAADVNGDGRPDLIYGNSQGNALTVVTNDGSGGFVASGTYTAGNMPIYVTAADVNGDGKVDLIEANQGDNTLTVLTNNGSGGFVVSGTYAAGVYPESVTAADVNGDGWVDLISANQNGNTLTVLTNNGSGGFVLASTLNGGNGPRSVVAAYVNGDNKLDLICANSGGNTLSVLTNATPFPPPVPPVITSFTPTSAFAGSNVIISGLNFSPVASNNIVYFGAVRATVTSASTTSLTVTVPVGATFAPITETINGLTAYSRQPFLPTFPGGGILGSSSFGPQLVLGGGNGPSRVAFGDMDGDGKPDVVVANVYDGSIWIYRNISTNGALTTGSLAPPVIFTIGGGRDSTWGLALADTDGDGRLDIVVGNRNLNMVSIFQNFSTPGNLTTNSFGARVDYPVAGAPFDVRVADFDGDGRPDIVVVDEASNMISVLRNIGSDGAITSNSFAVPVNFAVGSSPGFLAIADLDGDGKPDVVVGNGNDSNNAVSVLRNISTAGNISFAPTVYFPGFQSSQVAIADVDGDGKPDLIIGSSSSGQAVSIYRNTSSPGNITTNSFAPHVDYSVGGWGNSVAVADLDGDGKPDVLVTTQLPSHLSLFRNTSSVGTISLGSRIDLAAGYNPNGLAIGDLNGDGRPDIVFGNSYDNTISIYQNIIPTSTSPTITSQPQDVYVHAFDPASFSVTAIGATSYHWFFNGFSIPSATSSTLNFASVVQSNLGPYSVVAANSYGTVTSSIANLYMYPSIVTPFTGLITDWGQSTTLSILAWGTGPLTFQWYDNGILIPNATNSTLTFAAIQFTNAGSYSVVVSSSLGSVTNTAAQVVVNPAGVSLGLYPGLTITGTVGYTYNIQSNPDLTNPNGWTTVATVTLWQPTQFWVDVNNNAASPTNQHRFYRVLPVP